MADPSNPVNGMNTTAPDGTKITPYNRAGLVTAMRPDRPAPVTPMQEVPNVSIVSRRVDAQGNLYAKLSDGTEKKLDRQTFDHHATQMAALEKARGNDSDD